MKNWRVLCSERKSVIFYFILQSFLYFQPLGASEVAQFRLLKVLVESSFIDSYFNSFLSFSKKILYF